jgi:hypothetical protein
MGARAGRTLRQQDSYAILRIPKDLHHRQNPTIMKKILLDTLTSLTTSLRNSRAYGSSPRGLLLILLVTACFALSPGAQAAGPEAPEAGLPNGNTAEGDGALSGLTGGFYNSAFGFLSLLSNADASFNTGVGAGTLLVNTANENTAVGAAALFSNTTGGTNTSVGAFALFSNVTGAGNTATGHQALLNNIDGFSNTAIGRVALTNHTTGGFNTSVGNQTLESHTSGSGNVAMGSVALGNLTSGDNNVGLGRFAGSGLTTSTNVIALGFNVDGISTTNGELSDSCYIGNIIGAGVDAGTAFPVFVDQDGKLGTVALPNTGALPSAQAFSGKVRELETTVAQQAKAIEVLTAQLNDQAAQIQRVSAQLEVRKPAAQVANYQH